MGSHTSPKSTTKRVCIIGGGASGITALSQALEAGLDAVLYEARSELGGAWLLSDEAGPCIVTFEGDEATVKAPGETTAEGAEGVVVNTPMYPSLRTNVPTSLMEYRGHRFPPSVVSSCRLSLRRELLLAI